MPAKKNSATLIVGILIAFSALLLGFFIAQSFYAKKKLDGSKFYGTLLENPRPVSEFTLIGIDQKEFNNTSLKGKWTMVFFGFTSCGYVCPTIMAELNKMYTTLQAQGVSNLPHIVMISIDPERDNLKKLGEYVHAFNPTFYGATGSDEMLKQMTQELGVAYAKVIPQDTGLSNYDMEHTGAIMLFNPTGELNAFFTSPHQAKFLVEDYKMLITN